MKLKEENFRQQVKVFAPATVANLVCGFDILGLALDAPGDVVIMRRRSQPGLVIDQIVGDVGKLSQNPARNTVSVSAQAFLDHVGMSDYGLEIELHKQMPIGSGLGSSAASAVAGVYAANLMLGSPLDVRDLLPFAMLGEKMACGDAHADNVAPSLLGGISLIRSYQPLDVISLPVPEALYVSVLYPHVDVPTREARKMIKNQVALKQAVIQWGNIAGLVSGIYTRDYDLIGRSLTDVIVEPVRSILIPEFAVMRSIAMQKGALGFGISGSGPSVFAFSMDPQIAEAILVDLTQHLKQHEVDSTSYFSKINEQGPREI